MAAPKGNKFWMARYNHGRKPKVKTATELWNACVKYFEWVEANPLWENKVGFYQGEGFDHPVAKMRAPTIAGLCIFLGWSTSTWDNYKSKDGFLEVITRVESVLYDWKFAGAAAELFNPNIIARDLGLRDKQDVTTDGLPIKGVTVTYD